MRRREPLLGDPPIDETHDGVAALTHDAVAEVVLNRPAVLNALDLSMWRRLTEVFGRLSTQSQTRVVVIRGAGQRAFSAGADIAEFREHRTGAAKAREYNEAIAVALTAIRDTSQPVVAMIGGLAIGGGCEIAAASDLRIAADTARFGIPIGRLGVTLGVAEASTVMALIGPSQTKRLIFTDDLVDASEALRIGLVDRVVPRDALEGETWQIAQAIASKSPVAARANKLVVNLLAYGSTPEKEEALHRLTADVYEGPDLQEGIAAFVEKRQPRFTGDADG